VLLLDWLGMTFARHLAETFVINERFLTDTLLIVLHILQVQLLDLLVNSLMGRIIDFLCLRGDQAKIADFLFQILGVVLIVEHPRRLAELMQ
jgi:hypothetical protein